MSKRAFPTVIAACAVLATTALSAQNGEFGQWRPLFSGNDLSGWVNARDKQAVPEGWVVEDGTLLMPGAGGKDIATVEEFADYELEIDYQLPPGGNSGIYLRGVTEIQVKDRREKDNNTPPTKTSGGAIYGKFAALKSAQRPAGKWNHFRILHIGFRITVWHNEELIQDNVYYKGTTGGAMKTSHIDARKLEGSKGPILLQGDHGRARYRNIRIRSLFAREDGWRSLWSGRDLAAFTARGNEKARGGLLWRVEGRAFKNTASGSDGHNIWTWESFDNFLVHYAYRCNPDVGKGNSGFYLRDQWEIQILAESKPGEKTTDGALYSLKAPDVMARSAPTQWNHMDVKVEGMQIWVWQNGKLIHNGVRLRTRTDDPSVKTLSLSRAPFKFQGNHGQVAFTDLYVKPLGGHAERSLAEQPSAPARKPDYAVELDIVQEGWDGKKCWVHTRAGTIPPRSRGNATDTPVVVMTTQKQLVSGNDIFDGLYDLRTDDLGAHWEGPRGHAGLRRRSMGEDLEAAPCDFTPKWHARSGKLLGTGKTFWYRNNHQYPRAPSDTIYAVYDPARRSWGVWKRLEYPAIEKFKNASAGCSQRYDLPNGDILLPIYLQPSFGTLHHKATVVLCGFDGDTLTYREHGDEIDLPTEVAEGDGFSEPSLTRFRDTFYLTLRSVPRAYVTRGTDGLHFEKPRPWTFDDRKELGNHNTQQHWVTHSDGLFLVYTRRGAKNDHIFRYRAPLFMARVDPDRLVLERATERILVPETGTRMGNFGIVDVRPLETWVVTTEWMQHPPPGGFARYGSNNRIFLAKIHWRRPNRLLR